MIVEDLYLGDVEGAEEFKDKERIDNLYFMGVTAQDLDALLSGDKRYIHGYKGTGKTSLLKVLECQCKAQGIPYVSISYRKIREDAEVVNEFRKRFRLFRDSFTEEEDKDTTTLTFWKWYLLSFIAKEFIKVDPVDLIYSTSLGFFRAIASVLDMLIVTIDPCGHIGLGLNVHKQTPLDKDDSISRAAQKIRSLTNKIRDRLRKKVVIFVDELELTKARSTYGLDKTMIKNLILATKHINNISEHLHIVLAVRDEVVYDLRGDEINKLLDSFGVSLTWWTSSRVTVDHPLWRLMFKKIRHSMRNKVNPDILSDALLWERWFPFKIDNKESWKFFFEITWARPRDFVRLLNLMSNQCRKEKSFTRASYDHAVRSYSQSALSEISEEISTLFDDTVMRAIQNTIQSLGINFRSDDFVATSRKLGLTDASIALDEMYRVGLIGNHYPEGNFGMWRWFYRKDTIPDRSKLFEVRRALHDALGIRGRFNQSVYYT